MFKRLLATALIALLFACSPDYNNQNPPKNTLGKEKLAEVLTDIHLLEAQKNIQTGTQYQMTSDTVIRSWYRDVFRHHKTDEKTFRRSLKFYQENQPIILKSIYDTVTARLNARLY